MAAAARTRAENGKRKKRLDKDEARGWLYEQARAGENGSFVITLRNLGVMWGWSTVRVRNLLNAMELAGQLSREVLPNNGGTRLTIAGQDSEAVIVPMIRTGQAVKNDSGRENWSFADIETLQSPPPMALMDRLAHAYHAIIYGEAGFEGCDVEHLELIEQALFDRAANDNESDETKVAA